MVDFASDAKFRLARRQFAYSVDPLQQAPVIRVRAALTSPAGHAVRQSQHGVFDGHA
jgi:hypothetical protein